MKKIIFLLICLLSSIYAETVEAQSPIANFSLMGGNTYFFKPNRGDGSYRWAEARLLFGKENDYRLLSAGVFFNYVEVGSKIDSFLYHDQEYSGGLAINFGSQYWMMSNEVWGWLNVGLKYSKDRGQIDLYDTKQTDKSFYMSGGLMLKNTMNEGPFFIKKLLFDFRAPTKQGERHAYWDGLPTLDSLSNKGRIKVALENTFFSTPVNMAQTLRFEPKIMGSITNEFSDHRNIYSLGLGLTLAREYSQELITLEGKVHFDPKYGTMYSVGVMISFSELAKAIVNH